MKYKRVGKSGLKISQLCLGTNNIGKQVNEKNAIKIIRKAFDLGINVIDTANGYTNGRSEEIIGKAIEGYRKDVVIATKVGSEKERGPNQRGLSRKNIRWQVKQRLKRLKIDFIDLYYLHRPDPDTPLEESLKTISDLVHEGIVNYIACSNFPTWQIAKAHEICETYNLERFIAVQPEYNLLKRDIETDLLPFCKHEKLGVLTYSPLIGGLLTGKYMRRTSPPVGSRAEYRQSYWEYVNKNYKFTVLPQIEDIAKNVGISMHQLAVAWILKNPLISAPIVGASKVEHVEENCQITEINLSNNIYMKLNKLNNTN